MIKRIFTAAYSEAEADKHEDLSAVDHKAIIILLTSAFCMSMLKYFGEYGFLRTAVLDAGLTNVLSSIDHFLFSEYSNLGSLAYWVLAVLLFYFMIPVIIIRFVFRQSLSQYGLRNKAIFSDIKVYLLMLVVMLPLVYFFSKTSSFQQRYPFLYFENRNDVFPNLLKWELIYFIQFFAVEFFFRGFMLHGLKPRFGFYSVFVMTVPYCMIHFGKPLPETLAAIIAGVALGCLSLKSRSIWLGVLIHFSVGLSMDLASLFARGMF
jgi:uncharacterized protein